jgi:ribonuclease Z
VGEEIGERSRRSKRQRHTTEGLRPCDVVVLRQAGDSITATAFSCDHTVPSLGYLFQRTSQRLLPQFAALPPAELARLRRSGSPITGPHKTPLFAFLGDGTADTLRAIPEWLDGHNKMPVPVVITECSFLYEEHRPVAQRTKHTLWSDLEDTVRSCNKTIFVLTHFSLRYTDQEVRDFFSDKARGLGNLVIWVGQVN